MNKTLQSIEFKGNTILTVEHNGVQYVAMKPICESIGIDWDGQRQKIKRHAFLASTAVIITAVAEDGKLREMQMLPIKYIQGWLFCVDANRVKAEIKDKLITYQKECFDVLHDYWQDKSIQNKTYASSTAACFSELHVFQEVTRGRMKISTRGNPYNTVSMPTALVLHYLYKLNNKEDDLLCISTRKVAKELKICKGSVRRSINRMDCWGFLTMQSIPCQETWVRLHRNIIDEALALGKQNLLTNQQSVGFLPVVS